jgi:plasmid stabilization system protein ParE
VIKPLVVLPQVEFDLRNGSAWYELQARGLGEEFQRTFYSTLSELQRNPAMFQIVFGDYRRRTMGKFPYAIYYFIEDERIVVASLFHSSRDPLALFNILKNRREGER